MRGGLEGDGGDEGDRLEEEGADQASNNTKQNNTQEKENDKF